MKNLNTYIQEGLFDNIGIGPEHQIEEWIKENCVVYDNLKIKLIKNMYYVSAKEIAFKETSPILTNGMFKWFNVQTFYCSHNTQIKTLEGSPKICKDFTCSHCSNLESLEGAPAHCTDFYCNYCPKLKSLKGLEKMKCQNLGCNGCDNLSSIKDMPNELWECMCTDNPKFKSLKDFTNKKIKYLIIQNCGVKVRKEDIDKINCKIDKIML